MVVVRSPAAEKEPGKEPAKKPPIPDKEQYQAMKGKIVKIFQKEFAEAKTAEAKLALAVKLDAQGDAAKDDPVERYSLWRIAADGASAAGEFALAVKIVDKIQAQFDVDGDAMKFELLNVGAVRTTLTPEAARDLCEAALKLANGAVSRDDFDAAGRFARLAATAAHRVKEPQFNRDVLAREREIEHLKSRYALVAKAMETLSGDPDSAAANLAVGQWHCFAKGNWEKGLPMLAKGSDPDLAAIAKQDLAAPAKASDQMDLGDAWWNLAQKQSAASRSAVQLRAASWYKRCLPGLSGLDKIRVQKRLETPSAEPQEAKPSPFIARGGAVVPGNVALATNGTTVEGVSRGQMLIDGDVSDKLDNYAATKNDLPFDCTITFKQVYRLRQIRVLFWHGDNRYYNFGVSASSDGQHYLPLADRSVGQWRGWQVIDFPPRAVKTLKLFGVPTKGTTGLMVVEIEAYCIPPAANSGKK